MYLLIFHFVSHSCQSCFGRLQFALQYNSWFIAIEWEECRKKVKKKFHALRYGYSWEVPLIEHIFRKSGREISFKIYVKMLAHFWWLEYLDMQKYQMSLIAVSAGTCNSNKKSCLIQQTESAETWKPIHSPFLLSFSFL